MNLLKTIKSPLNEQKICVKCGFCCDGTLFPFAVLQPEERENLPEKIEQNYYRKNDDEYFRLPCHYFSEKCTIYDKKRAHVCGSFRCQLLMDFTDQKISKAEALDIVERARDTRIELLEQFKTITGNTKNTPFYQALKDLGKIVKIKNEENKTTIDLEILLVRFNIFESLLIRHFKSSLQFESLIIKGDKGKTHSL